MAKPAYRLGVDVGGTFTDVLLLREDTGETFRSKVHTTPADQSHGVLLGIDAALAKVPDQDNITLNAVHHGTTVATNIILEQKGAKVAVIVTEGYKDILQTRRSQVPGGLASWIIWKKPEPLAPLELTVEAPERLDRNGKEVRPFDEEAFREKLQPILQHNPDAVTISLMNAYANPSHEHLARRIVSEVLPHTPVSISSEVMPEMMEYERTITTLVNSYVEPSVSAYLGNLLTSLENRTKHLRILRSDGGLSSVKQATRFPVNWILSGPAGGVTGATTIIADRTKYKNLLTLDMGGTSTDVALVEKSVPCIRRETKIGDIVVKAPSIDVRTVGAGGGSIAQVPEVTKALRVGPESAGAEPGPACYGKGGSNATVTDANAVLGYLPTSLLGGAFKLDLGAARKAVQQVADELGTTLYEAAEGIVRVANETMYGALRLVSVEQGYDPRDFSLVAFGGAGPLHANALGKLIQSFPVIIPPSPGVLCAYGDATTTLRHEVGKSFIERLGAIDFMQLTKAFEELRQEAEKVAREEQGLTSSSSEAVYQADLRYAGQGLTITVDTELQRLSTDGFSYLRELFEIEHERLFTYRLTTEVETANLRVIIQEPKNDLPITRLEKAESTVPAMSSMSSTTMLVFEGQEITDRPIWERSRLELGHVLQGPCIISEMDSTTLVLPGYRAEIDELGNVLIWELEKMQGEKHEMVALHELDTFSVDIFENALRNARNEMDTLVTRTAMSPAIREQQDEFPLITEPGGKMIAGQLGSFIGQFFETWNGTIEPDDVLITNDPYSVGGAVSHYNDWLIMMPIHVDRKLIAWTAVFGHMTDVGGSVPGSLPCAAGSVFEEGIQIPVTKIASEGVWNNELLNLIYRNVRLPEWNRCDVHALVAACILAGKRMKELYTRFGDRTYFAIIDELLDRNRKAVTAIIAKAIPDQPTYFEDWIDDDGQGVGPWKIACTMSKDNGKLKFDFSGTDPQSPSSINFLLSITMFKMFVGIYLLVVYDPSVVANDGFHELLDIYIPEGSLLKPVRPAALSCRTHMLGRLLDVLSALLGQKAPEFMTAAGFSDSPHFMYSGYKDNGEWFQLYWLGFGGIPARPHGDGPDGHCLWPAMHAISNEFLERYYPLLINTYCLVPDSGGPGLYRGGNGMRIHWQFLCDGEISIHDDRWLSKPWGVLGGEPGARSRKVLVRYSLDKENPPREVCGSKVDRIKVRKGDVLEWITWGGGGWGDPLERDPSLVGLEVRRGLVTREGAGRYGVVVGEEGDLDMEGTDSLRQEMGRGRGGAGPEIFNRGGTWEELKAKCLEETGLPAPRDPKEVELRGPGMSLPYFREWKEQNTH